MWAEERRYENSWDELTWVAKSWEELKRAEKDLRRVEINWDEMGWDELRRPDMRRVVESWEELSWDELRRMQNLRNVEKKRRQMSWKAMRKAQMTWEKMRAVVICWEERRRGQKTCDEVKKLSRHDVRWDGMTESDSRMPWAMRSCDAMRWNEQKIQNGWAFENWWRRHESQKVVSAKHGRLAHTLSSHTLFRSIGFRHFKLNISTSRLARALLATTPLFVTARTFLASLQAWIKRR